MLTKSQKKVLNYVRKSVKDRQRALVYNCGGVRAGKSYGSILALIEHWTLRGRPTTQGMILAYTSQLAQSVFGPIIDLVVGEIEGLSVKVNYSMVNPRATVEDSQTGNRLTVLFRAAGHAGDERAIQGLTLSALIVDELSNLKRQVVSQAECRVSEPLGLRVFCMNKTSRHFWANKYYADRIRSGEIPGLVVDSELKDNPHISEDYIRERQTEFTGRDLERFINNQYTPDSNPQLVPQLETDQEYLDKEWRRVVVLNGTANGDTFGYEFAELPVKGAPHPTRLVLAGVDATEGSTIPELTDGSKRPTTIYYTQGASLHRCKLRDAYPEAQLRPAYYDVPTRELAVPYLQLRMAGPTPRLKIDPLGPGCGQLLECIEDYGIADGLHNRPALVDTLLLINCHLARTVERTL